jgi:hypothetical protein
MGKPMLFEAPIPRETIQRLADEEFGNMVKFVVDLDREVLCAGGGLHSDEEAVLLENGSKQTDLWGANFYLDRPRDKRLVYTSMINIRPRDNNRKQEIESEEVRRHVKILVDRFFVAFS